MTSYRWEASAERSWDDLEEDSSGLLHDAQAAAHYKTQRLEYASRSAKRRMVRYMVLVVDLSLGLDPKLNTELRPNPFTVFRRLVEMFINDFFEKNPVSQLGIVVTRDKHAHLVSHIGGSPKQHVAKMEKEWSENPSGQPTLENSLRIAQQALLGTPTYGSREIVVLFGSAHTVDPGDIHEAITDLRSHGIRSRCAFALVGLADPHPSLTDSLPRSVVGVGAALHICQVLANQTQGLYHVGGNALELEQLVLFHATPPPLTVQMLRDQPAELIQMGFPQVSYLHTHL
jgi:transcription initiation factor TFIIH subunit 2